MSKIIKREIEIGGRSLSFEVGRLAGQTDMAVFGQYGETCVLVTITSGGLKPAMDYFPLRVDYLEKYYAGGVIKGSRWVKREGRPSDGATLSARLIDRSIRPRFAKEYMDETHVVITVLSIDKDNDPVLLGALTAFAALTFSSLPWQGPLGAVSVGQEGDKFILNPTTKQKQTSNLDLLVSGTGERVVMIEGTANQVPRQTMAEAIEFGQKNNVKLIAFIKKMDEEIGVKKISFKEKETKILMEKVDKKIHKDLEKILSSQENVKEKFFDLKKVVVEDFEDEKSKVVEEVIEKLFKKMIKKNLLAGKRPDGRKIDQVRPLKIEEGVLPRTHGSALFSRGATQVLTITTLGPLSLSQTIESAEGEEIKHYMHHYYMPPFTVGEAGYIGGPGRREIGHGALAEKALEPVLPEEKDFPYAMRLVSEVMSANGSTSMASVCGSSLSLMNAGVPIKAPVAGIAMGIVTEKIKDGEKYQILTDIAGIEDFNGEMDFKVTGTEEGITAIQLDVKNNGLTGAMVAETLTLAYQARHHILMEMNKVLAKPRSEISPYAPQLILLKIDKEKIGDVIGSGGRTIREISEKTNCEINVDDDGQVTIMGKKKEAIQRAADWIKGLTTEPEVGKVYQGEVKRIESFGAFVEILPGQDGLVHVSRMADGFVKDPNDVLSVGDKVKVKLYKIDDRHRINLSMILDGKSEKKANYSNNNRSVHKDNRQSHNKNKPSVDRFAHFRTLSKQREKGN